MAITKTSAATAAACALSGLKQGGGAFFFFASDDSMRLLFQQPADRRALRPNAIGRRGQRRRQAAQEVARRPG